jgi:hypothetical protein
VNSAAAEAVNFFEVDFIFVLLLFLLLQVERIARKGFLSAKRAEAHDGAAKRLTRFGNGRYSHCRNVYFAFNVIILSCEAIICAAQTVTRSTNGALEAAAKQDDAHERQIRIEFFPRQGAGPHRFTVST